MQRQQPQEQTCGVGKSFVLVICELQRLGIFCQGATWSRCPTLWPAARCSKRALPQDVAAYTCGGLPHAPYSCAWAPGDQHTSLWGPQRQLLRTALSSGAPSLEGMFATRAYRRHRLGGNKSLREGRQKHLAFCHRRCIWSLQCSTRALNISDCRPHCSTGDSRICVVLQGGLCTTVSNAGDSM
jgi:hypothetical protein